MTREMAELEEEVSRLAREFAVLQRSPPTPSGRSGLAPALVFCLAVALAVGVAHFETRVQAAPTMVAAPFTVVNNAGEPIFVVQQRPTGPSVEVQVNRTFVVQLGIGEKGNAAAERDHG